MDSTKCGKLCKPPPKNISRFFFCPLPSDLVSSAMQIQQKSFCTFQIKFKNAEVTINTTSNCKDPIQVYSITESPYLKYNPQSDTELIVAAAGDYESKDVFIAGKKVNGDNSVVYTIAGEEITIGVVSFVTKLDSIPVDFFESVDIVILGAGGGMNLSPKDAHEFVQKITPKVCILHGFAEQDSKDVKLALLPLEEVKKDITGMNITEKPYKITKEELDRIENTTELYYFEV